MPMDNKNLSIEAHTGTLLGQGELYLGKITVPISREFCQASCGIEGFLGKLVVSIEDGNFVS